MRKRFLSMLLLLGMLLSFTGCECNHRWSEVDCVNASACDKCGEIQGEALGHEWSEADCLNPVSCSRCGETQGEALGHSFGNWIPADSYIIRSCMVCGEEETLDADFETVLAQQLCGLWTSTSTGIYSMWEQSDIPTTDFSLMLNEDGSFTALLDREITGTWTVSSYSVELSFFRYDVSLVSEFWSRPVKLSFGPSGAELIIDRGNDTERYYFAKMSEEEVAEYNRLIEDAPKMITGKWEGTNGSAQFNEDGSMSLDFGTVYDGFWTFTRMYKADTNTLHVIYTLDCSDFYNCTMHVSNDSRKIIIFASGSSYELFLPEVFSEVMDELERVPGRWSSSTMYIHDENRDISGEASGEYYLELKEGGSFSGYLGKDVSGRWQFSGLGENALQFVFHLNGNEKTGYIYDLVDDVLQAWLYNSEGKQISFELIK